MVFSDLAERDRRHLEYRPQSYSNYLADSFVSPALRDQPNGKPTPAPCGGHGLSAAQPARGGPGGALFLAPG
jgi:hypothetical protein